MRTVEIGCVVDPVKKWNPRREGTGAFTYVDISSVDQRTKTVFEPSSVDAAEAPSRARQLIAAGDVLVSTVRPNLNAVAYVKPALDGATASTGYCVLRPRPSDLDGRYLFHWVRAAPFVAHLVQRATGASYPAVSDKIVKAAPIPLPPIEEQRRIAAVLDAAEALRMKRRRALAKLDELTQAVFQYMFSEAPPQQPGQRRVREHTRWQLCPLGKVADIERETVRPVDIAGHEPYVGLEHIDSGGRFAGVEAAERTGLRSNKFAFTSSHVLYGKLRPYLSKIAAPDFAGICSTDILPIRPSDRLDRRYLLHCLRTPAMVAQAASKTSGINLPRLSPSVLESFIIPVPPMEEQRRFAAIVNRVETLRTRQSGQLGQLDTLFASLQQRAFRGEL